jgi:hypothetical protein
MAGEDPLDPSTLVGAKAQRGPYTQYLRTDSLKGKRFGVPVCVLQGLGIPFQGIPASATPAEVRKQTKTSEKEVESWKAESLLASCSQQVARTRRWMRKDAPVKNRSKTGGRACCLLPRRRDVFYMGHQDRKGAVLTVSPIHAFAKSDDR